MIEHTSHIKELSLPKGEGMTDTMGDATVRAMVTALLTEAGIENVADVLKKAPNQDFLNTDVEIVTRDTHDLAMSHHVIEQDLRQLTVRTGGIIDLSAQEQVETDVTYSSLRIIARDARLDKVTD